jgi:SAM-dependent methyltransferase
LQVTPAFARLLGYGEVRGAYLGKAGKKELAHAVSSNGESFFCHIDLFDAERDEFPYESESVDCVVCSELLEHLGYDPMHMLFEVNRILKIGGTLVLSTPNVTSLDIAAAALRGQHPSFYSAFPVNSGQRRDRHDREYTPDEVRSLLIDAGLTVQRLETGPYSYDEPPPAGWVDRILLSQKLPRSMRGRCTFAVAAKCDGPRTRYPSWLYDAESRSDPAGGK